MRANITSKRGKLYIVITYEDMTGQIKKKWYGTGLDDIKANKKEAENQKIQIFEEFRKNQQYIKKSNSEITFSEYMKQWLERIKPNLQVSTYATYKMQVDKITNYFANKNIMLLDLQPTDISNFYAYLIKNGKTIQLCEHYHVNIRKCLQSAVKANLIPYNPADRVDRPKSPKHIGNFYTKEELDKLFECLIGDNYAYIYKITAYYGLRRSEMMGIKWDAIDFQNKTLTLNHAVIQTKVNGKTVIVAKNIMKNKSSYRTLPLLPEIRDLLLELKKKQERNKELYGNQYTSKYADYICVDDLGYRLKPSTVSSHFQLVLNKNNLKKIKYHELRHSCASILLAKGVSMKEIQEWLGHSSYNTTANIYSHLDPKAKNNVANVITKTFDYYDEEDLENDVDNELGKRDEVFELPTPKPIYSVRHRENQTSVDLELDSSNNLEFELENKLNNEKDKNKYIYVYENKETGNLGMVKRFSDITDEKKFIQKVKSLDEVNDLMVELFSTTSYSRDYLKEFNSKLKKKVKELDSSSEM